MIVKIDNKGRIYLPKEIREKIDSKEFYIVELTLWDNVDP
ncbi:AbrB/MazE/SpoVT family DNA-binding domain-containing protein [Sulfurisphaera ohwakuensis]|uniref:AbrB family looped-hinge helix DNA binding protein n=1 Tax=Sulfurisphaera ohwakuensis TaxID=69656 RepID=A0A7J9RT74_SULOH|nr:hypothetical protein [Sulfurisphaera ohwakuensis]MBB5254198.1 AbrB family looped-hinge helix DNA binding protein [Sulfurisphaera ohwakuensis]